MARRRKRGTDNVVNIHDGPEHSSGHNGGPINADKVKHYVGRVENLYDDLETAHANYMVEAKRIREDIGLVLDDAKASGIPKRELKAVIKTRSLERKLERIRSNMEADAQETYDQIRFALGDLEDTPLGQAALAKAPQPEGAQTLDDLTA